MKRGFALFVVILFTIISCSSPVGPGNDSGDTTDQSSEDGSEDGQTAGGGQAPADEPPVEEPPPPPPALTYSGTVYAADDFGLSDLTRVVLRADEASGAIFAGISVVPDADTAEESHVAALPSAANEWIVASVSPAAGFPDDLAIVGDLAVVASGPGLVLANALTLTMEHDSDILAQSTEEPTALLIVGDDLFIGTNKGLFTLPTAELAAEAAERQAATRVDLPDDDTQPNDRRYVTDVEPVEDLVFIASEHHGSIGAKDLQYYQFGLEVWDTTVSNSKDAFTRVSQFNTTGARTLLVHDGTIFVGAVDGLFSSTDPTGTYTEIELDPDPDAEPEINELAVGNGVLYAATSEGLFYSTDDGATWELFDGGTNFPTWLDTVAVLGDTVFVGVGANDVLPGVYELHWK